MIRDDTRALIKEAKSKGYTIKLLSEMSGISIGTLYNFTYGRNISKEKEEKLLRVIHFLLNIS